MIDIKLTQKNISPSCLQDILDLLNSDYDLEILLILKEHEVEVYQ